MPLNPLSQNAPQRQSAVVSRFAGPKRLAQPFRATVTFRLTESEAEKYGLGGRWRSAMNRRLGIATRKASAKARLDAAVAGLLTLAETKHLSQREMTRQAGLSWGSFRRCRDGRVNPTAWLPKIQTALNRISTN